jgi:DNA-binding NarL/FixJ family response regulator
MNSAVRNAGVKVAVKLLLVEDHAIVRQGLRIALASIGGVKTTILEAAALDAAILLAAEHADIDLVLLDLNLPGSEAVDPLISFRQKHPDLPVLVFSAQNDPQVIRQTFLQGASGYASKAMQTELLKHAVQIILDGGIYLPPELLTEQLAQNPPAATSAPQAGTAALRGTDRADVRLQSRQRDVLLLLLDGLSNKEISQRLGLSVGTTKNHMANLLRLFDVGSRSQLICLLRSKPELFDA